MVRIGLNVRDLDLAEEFYVQALGFAPAGDSGENAALARLLGVRRAHTRVLELGGQRLELTRCDPPGLDYPADSDSTDTWFQHFAMTTPDIAAAVQRLGRHRYTPITQDGPQQLSAASGGAIAYRFRDPDGHPLELIQPAGNPRSAGISHSALTVTDLGLSITFYGQLGFSQASRHVSAGPEQGRLDGLPDADVEVVAMRPSDQATPHIELLHYRGRPGRAMITDLPDIVATRLVLEGDTTDGKAAGMFDPDGHALLIAPAASWED